MIPAAVGSRSPGLRSGSNLRRLAKLLARRAAVAATGVTDWRGPIRNRDDNLCSARLEGDGGAVFRFVDAYAGLYVVVAAQDGRMGLGLALADRQFGPGLLELFAGGERDWIWDGRKPEALTVAAPGDGPGWQALPGDVNARALEVWAKKRAYLQWLGAGVEGGLAGFDVTEPESLGVRFSSVAFGSHAPGVVGWVCSDALGGAEGLEVTWVDAADLPWHESDEPSNAVEVSAQFSATGDLVDMAAVTRVAGVAPTETVVRDRWRWRGNSWESWLLDAVSEPVLAGTVADGGAGDIMDLLGQLEAALGPRADAIGEYCCTHGLDVSLYAAAHSPDGRLPKMVVTPCVGRLAARMGARLTLLVRTYDQ
jgi:hypothetical protein